MADVFISFVHEDQAVADAIKKILEIDLRILGRVFLVSDKTQLHAGEDWLARIRSELGVAKVLILMMSNRAVRQPWVNFEAGAGWIQGRPLISVCYGNMTKDRLPKPYSDLQAVNIPAEEEYLVHSVAHHLDVPKPSQGMKDPGAKPKNLQEIILGDAFEVLRPKLSIVLSGFVDEK